MKRIFLYILTFSVYFTISFLHAQKESSIWYFGDRAGLDFNSGSPVALDDGKLFTKEGCATISDTNGNLLFYTNGVTVWDRQHQEMPNGFGLLGHSSSTQSALIVPKPGSTSCYYVFTVDKPSYFLSEGVPIDGVNYSEVDMSLNNGYGDVVSSNKNIHLITYDVNDSVEREYKSSEKITAVTHSSGAAIWVITHFTNKFFAFLVDENGVNSSPVVSNTPLEVLPKFNDENANITAIGYLKVSPDGKKIAIAHSSTTLGGPNSGTKKSGRVLLYDFDNATGKISNQTNILSNTYPYGLEFSPNSNLLYVTVGEFNTDDLFQNSLLLQYNLESTDISGSKETISNNQNVAGALQLAVDGKIYRAGYQTLGVGTEISVINDPNSLGFSCNYDNNSISLLPGTASQLGLPQFVQSLFFPSFNYEFTCLGDATHFYITSEDSYDTVLWDFGDGTVSSEIEPFHTYAESGTYLVSLTFTVNGVDYEPYVRQVVISAPPNVMQSTLDLIQCDSFDNDPSDGISTFNLALANNQISLNTTEAVLVYYYHNETEAINDIHNVNALNTIYTNQFQGETLTAKVIKTNTDCYNIATLTLLTKESVQFDDYNLVGCDSDNDGVADFDLNLIRNAIIESLDLSTNVNISFHLTQEDAFLGSNPIPDDFSSEAGLLYFSAASDNACYGNGILNLSISEFPDVQDQIITTCTSEFPMTIYSGLDSNDLENFNFEWDNGLTTPQIEIYEPGNYILKLMNPLNSCEKIINISVLASVYPTIQELIILNNSIEVVLNNSSAEDFLFNIDDEFGIYQSENIFYNIQAGTHLLYVKDLLNCYLVKQEFFILGFPKYFTPNADGINDYWNILGLESIVDKNISVKIFDRFGKTITEFNPFESHGWDGKMNGKLLYATDYWYVLKLPDGKEYKGHFALKM